MDDQKTLKDLIQEANLTYRELAERMGVVHTQVAVWCRPGANPTYRTLMKLAKELDVDLNSLGAAIEANGRGHVSQSEDRTKCELKID